MASRKRYRYTFEVVFSSEDQKALFSERVESVRRKMENLEGESKLNNFKLLSRFLAIQVEAAPGTETNLAPQEITPERLMNKEAAILDVESKQASI